MEIVSILSSKLTYFAHLPNKLSTHNTLNIFIPTYIFINWHNFLLRLITAIEGFAVIKKFLKSRATIR